ncbi:MAG: hypothetical protein WAZ48_16705 [Lysobacteraceae bacterium]
MVISSTSDYDIESVIQVPVKWGKISQTRCSKRLSVLFLLNMLAGFAAWLFVQALKRTAM